MSSRSRATRVFRQISFRRNSAQITRSRGNLVKKSISANGNSNTTYVCLKCIRQFLEVTMINYPKINCAFHPFSKKFRFEKDLAWFQRFPSGQFRSTKTIILINLKRFITQDVYLFLFFLFWLCFFFCFSLFLYSSLNWRMLKSRLHLHAMNALKQWHLNTYFASS